MAASPWPRRLPVAPLALSPVAPGGREEQVPPCVRAAWETAPFLADGLLHQATVPSDLTAVLPGSSLSCCKPREARSCRRHLLFSTRHQRDGVRARVGWTRSGFDTAVW